MSRFRILTALALALVVPSIPLWAQAVSPTTIRTEIQQAVHTYVDAWNRADASNLVEMYSRAPGVTSVGDGEIIRGWDRIRERYDSIGGIEGRFKIAIGSIDVVPMGANYALALTSYTLTIHADAGDIQERGAMTLVFQKAGGEWKVIHDHTSTLPQQSDLVDTLRSVPKDMLETGIRSESDQVYMESVVEERPEVVSGPQLVYPDLLRQAAIQGRVLVQAILDTTGRAEPQSVKVIQSPNPGFDQSAKDYVLRALFRPARVHGRAVRVLINLPIDFSIRRKR
jgi:uncharacterized protein (TIGR02246 family)